MAESPIVLCNDNLCRPMQPNGYSSGNIAITSSVGIKGVNQALDVQTIQQALNEVPPGQGRPGLALETDGICGPKTKDAVQKFQVKQFGWKFADGRVDPLKRTIAKLNQLNPKSGYTIGIGSKENRILRVAAVLNDVLNVIRAAQTNLLGALTVVDQPDLPTPISSFSRAERMRKANAHFNVDGHPPTQRSGVLRQILQIYDRMRQVFERPGGLWGPAIFELDPHNDPISLAYTFGGGFSRGGEKVGGLRADSIYLCELLDYQMNERIQLTVIHELSHFCGGRTGSSEHIRDHAYGWQDFPKMKLLTLQQRLHNATNYANFAFDAMYSRMPAGANF
jgi:peptidoglycan hydrolase-like protein with peptidoglycan-binding domain